MSSNFEVATGPIHLDNVQCTGDEEYLVNCTSAGPFQHDCSHLEDAGVDCEGENLPLKRFWWDILNRLWRTNTALMME